MSDGYFEVARQVAAKFHFDQDALNRAVSDQFWMVGNAIQMIQFEATRPSVLYRPALSLDGNQYCALYGPNLQEGCAGFGATPEQAMSAFDKAWQGGAE